MHSTDDQTQRRAAVIGQPIGHSLSPEIFSYLGEKLLSENDSLDYDAIEVSSSDLPLFIKDQAKVFVGFNVTLPHKSTIIPWLSEVSHSAELVGAVNVVHQVESDRWVGHNTDVSGIRSCWTSEGVCPEGKSVLILGAGGAARAAVVAAGLAGAKSILIWNRTEEKAQGLCSEMAVHFKETSFHCVRSPDDLSEKIDWLIQATSVGMLGGPDEQESFSSWISCLPPDKSGVAFDLVYRPLRTPFLSEAQSHGCTGLSGLGMLVDQALDTWEIWFNRIESRSAVRLDLLQHLTALTSVVTPVQMMAKMTVQTPVQMKSSRPVVLVGMMGSGKSTVGMKLSQDLGWKFIDLDQEIERRSGKSVFDLFETHGESGFREIEEEVFLKLSLEPKRVISLGGGAFSNPVIRDRVLQMSHTIYLDAKVDLLEERLAGQSQSRPLLRGLDRAGRIARLGHLLRDRISDFQRTEDRVEVDGKSIEDVVSFIRGVLQ